MTLVEPWNAIKVAMSLHTHALHTAVLLRTVLGQLVNKPGLASKQPGGAEGSWYSRGTSEPANPSQSHLTQIHSEPPERKPPIRAQPTMSVQKYVSWISNCSFNLIKFGNPLWKKLMVNCH